MNMQQDITTAPDDTIKLVLDGPATNHEWQALMKRYLGIAKQTGAVRLFAEVRDGPAWDSLTKFLYLVRWKLLDTAVQQRIALATLPALLTKATGLLATHTTNMAVHVVPVEQRAEADRWLLGA